MQMESRAEHLRASVSMYGSHPMSDCVLGVARSLSGRRWVWRSGEDRVGLGIAQRMGLPEIVGRLLAARGIDIDDACHFLDPTLRALLPDPSVLIDMDVAAERLAYAVQHSETVGVFGDYDVDGACSSALMVALLRQLGCEVLPHVPDRMMEGYGPNGPALHSLVLRGARLIVCVDCGTAAAEALGFIAGDADIVVLDHHKAEGPPPAIVATVNPNRLDCTSGLSPAVRRRGGVPDRRGDGAHAAPAGFFNARKEPDLIGLLDLVALATVCDVMPLTGVNRALVCQGLKVMARRARPGVAALLDVAQTRERPTACTCGYALGPRINAAGRISEADLGLRLLLCEDPVEAASLAGTLDAVNRQRQEVEASMLDAAMRMAEEQAGQGHAAMLVSGRGVASRRGRDRRRTHQGAVQSAGLRRRDRGWSGQGIRAFGGGARSWRGGDRGAADGHPEDRRRASDGGGVFAAAGAAGGFPCVPRRAPGRRGGVADGGRPVGGGHARGARRDDGTGAATGAAGPVRCRQRGADAGAATRPRGARRSRWARGRRRSARSSRARAAGRG